MQFSLKKTIPTSQEHFWDLWLFDEKFFRARYDEMRSEILHVRVSKGPEHVERVVEFAPRRELPRPPRGGLPWAPREAQSGRRARVTGSPLGEAASAAGPHSRRFRNRSRLPASTPRRLSAPKLPSAYGGEPEPTNVY